MQKPLSEANVIEYLRGPFPDLPATARAEAAGDGNINWVRRVRGGPRPLVVKQARPALEKFPEYAVSPERILHEARYYETVAALDRDGVCPAVLHLDPANHVLVMEDVGDAERLDAAQARGADVTDGLCAIARFLGRVHAGTWHSPALAPFPDGASDRGGVLELHLAHIFRLPFEANDFPLSPALRASADALAADADFVAALRSTEARCREREGALIHGDVQPTNILLPRPPGAGARLLDAEIAHSGSPAFDVGIFFAHGVLAELVRGRPGAAAERLAPLWEAYLAAGGGDARGCAFPDAMRVAGVEILRRTLGAARVPEVAEDAVGLAAVRVGETLLCEPPADPSGLRRLG